MAAVLTTGVKAQGNLKLNWVTTIAAPTTAVTVAEINAGVDVSCYFMADGWAPAVDVSRGTSPARLCTTIQFEQFGNSVFSLGDLRYSWQPQAAALASGVAAYEALVPGTSGYFVERQGLNATTSAWATTQFANIWPVTLGNRLSTGDTSDEFAEFVVTQGVIVTSTVATRIAIT